MKLAARPRGCVARGASGVLFRGLLFAIFWGVYMSKFKNAALALAAASLFSAPVHASEAQEPSLQAAPVAAVFSPSDIQAMFEQTDQPVAIAALSSTEMKETEAAWAPVVVWGLVNAPRITQFGMSMVASSAYQPWGHAFQWVNHQRVTHWPNSRWW